MFVFCSTNQILSSDPDAKNCTHDWFVGIGTVRVALDCGSYTAKLSIVCCANQTLPYLSKTALFASAEYDGEGILIAAYNHVLGTLKRIPSPSYSALANSAVFDKYGNVWFAQHTIDNLAVYDPQSKATLTVPIPTNQSWVQFLASGSDDNIWFVEQKTNKLGKVTVSEGAPSGSAPQRQSQENTISLATVAGPLMAAGVIVASLFFVNAVHNKRESDLFYSKTDHSKST